MTFASIVDVFCIAQRLMKVCERLDSLGGQLNFEKCQIIMKEVALLGHLVLAKGISLDPSRIKVLLELSSANES